MSTFDTRRFWHWAYPRLVDTLVAVIYGTAFSGITILSVSFNDASIGQLWRISLAGSCFVYWLFLPRKPMDVTEKVQGEGRDPKIFLEVSRNVDVSLATQKSSENICSMKDTNDADEHIVFSVREPSVSKREISTIPSMLTRNYDATSSFENIRRDYLQSIIWGLVSGVPLAAGLIAQSEVLSKADANKVALWCGMYVVLIPIFQGLRGRSVHILSWVGAALSLLAMCVYEATGIHVEPKEGESAFHYILYSEALPTILAIIQAIAFAVCYIIVEEAMSRYPKNALPFTAGLFVSTFAASLVWFLCRMIYVSAVVSSAAAGELFTFPFKVLFASDAKTSFKALFALLWTGLVCQAFPCFAENWALTRVPVTEHVIIISINPMFSAITARIFLKVPFTLRVGLAALASICAVIVSQLAYTSVGHMATRYWRIMTCRKPLDDPQRNECVKDSMQAEDFVKELSAYNSSY